MSVYSGLWIMVGDRITSVGGVYKELVDGLRGSESEVEAGFRVSYFFHNLGCLQVG